MKTGLVLLTIVLMVGLVFAGTTKKPANAAAKTHDMKAEVVSVDAAAKTITIKGDDGQEKTAPVLGKAVASLKNVKAGDHVMLTCQDNAQGEHEGVLKIRPIHTTAKASKKK